MRYPRLTTAFALCLATGCLGAGPWVVQPARADDSDVPGMKRTDPGLQRPAQENPEMKPFMTPAPAAVAAPAPARTAVAPPPEAAPVRKVALDDVDALLKRAEADIAAKRMKQAEADLARAQTELLNAKAAGATVPPQIMEPLAEARDALRHGHAAAAERATLTAERVIASAE